MLAPIFLSSSIILLSISLNFKLYNSVANSNLFILSIIMLVLVSIVFDVVHTSILCNFFIQMQHIS
ncbi:hypothetical protein HanXRQr2_Chr03g0094851 [Helianthus annuus]|uniref:Uncharacterized protein n=1 Tax=Helianthus annuus TaxID=4232 RepID=A0A251V678_HELAN|nr:hypothetical protein HanXRQr2_Chr03g0094851 [Helianthus annuus]KAJ0942396.1 hypothetical protein HanPSC8_Chr03g0091441 [Helianthus annuus]